MIANPNPPKIIGLNLAISFGKKGVRFIPKYDSIKSKIPKTIKRFPIITIIFFIYENPNKKKLLILAFISNKLLANLIGNYFIIHLNEIFNINNNHYFFNI